MPDLPVHSGRLPDAKSLHGFEIFRLLEAWERAGKPYLEFLRVPALSCGIYALPAGGEDLQRPHTEDEVYIVLAGRARFRCGTQTLDVGQGAILYVAKGAEHRFEEIVEDLVALVVFAPAERAGAGAGA